MGSFVFDEKSRVDEIGDGIRVSRVVDRGLDRALARDALRASSARIVGSTVANVLTVSMVCFALSQFVSRGTVVGFAAGYLLYELLRVLAAVIDPFVRWRRLLQPGQWVWAEFAPDVVITGTDNASDAVSRDKIVNVRSGHATLILTTESGQTSIVPRALTPPSVETQLVRRFQGMSPAQPSSAESGDVRNSAQSDN
ncbi:hypothetical protein [Gordonia sp. N1V]|uniref:hypothetical protein n=1 Tax=Gordonia sp. N1V TaxID=3034163 RepID=UPI0023E330BD|nr:hypothetical protein [Gordonia sp. N1V]MDF3280813.1 hypothetical protein [Gordonia sp. N1V]